MTRDDPNPHVGNADFMLSAKVAADDPESVSVLLHAIAESNLAVAHAQTTGNMIALATHLARTGRDNRDLERQIDERLGVNTGGAA